LENICELAGGHVQARCPACAEGGNDRSGEHLRIYSDGRLGCCVHPKDREHRKRIWALAGRKLHPLSPGSFSLRIKTSPVLPAVWSVKSALTGFAARTLRTPIFNPRAYAIGIDIPMYMCKDSDNGVLPVLTPLPPSINQTTTADLARTVARPDGQTPMRLPFLTAGGTLAIPFDSDPMYHWWKGGQSVEQTRAEVLARMKAEDDHRTTLPAPS
jgi:hypothetical protein